MEYVTLREKKVPVTKNADVIVCGGGPAGIAAALGAARCGGKTLLVERIGFLGGIATAGLNCTYMGWDRNVVGGVAAEILDRLALQKKAMEGFHSPFDAEAFKFTTMKMLVESGVDILFHSSAVDVVQAETGEIGVVMIHNKSGFQAIRTRIVVDATGDADVAALAGAKTIDDVPVEAKQPVSTLFRLGGVAIEETVAYIRRNPSEMHQWPLKCLIRDDMDPPVIMISGFFDCFKKAIADSDGAFNPERAAFGMTVLPNGMVLVNGTRMHGVDGTSSADISRAEVELHGQMETLVRFMVEYIPGFKAAYLIDSAAVVGVRESRRILGEYVLQEKDLLEGAHFVDAIGRNNCPMDIHGPPESPKDHRWVVLDAYYQLPYRALLPVGTKNLLVAGRCISATFEANSSSRSIPCCMTTGLAAGVAAALASGESLPLREIDVNALQSSLVRQKAII